MYICYHNFYFCFQVVYISLKQTKQTNPYPYTSPSIFDIFHYFKLFKKIDLIFTAIYYYSPVPIEKGSSHEIKLQSNKASPRQI